MWLVGYLLFFSLVIALWGMFHGDTKKEFRGPPPFIVLLAMLLVR